MICTILGRELKDVDVINNSRLWMIFMILGLKLKALDVMKSLGIWMT